MLTKTLETQADADTMTDSTGDKIDTRWREHGCHTLISSLQNLRGNKVTKAGKAVQ